MLKRDLDIVLIDGLDPFGGEKVVPSGRLREPLEALRRASIFVVTRCDSDVRFRAITDRLSNLNASAPVFRSHIQTLGWRDLNGERVARLPGQKAAAFCGLGNPQSFWNTLASLGLETTFRKVFRDHHRYTPGEIAELVRQAESQDADCLVTTEKDWINLPAGSEQIVASVEAFLA